MSKKIEELNEKRIVLIVEKVLAEKGEELTFKYSTLKWTDKILTDVVLEFKLPSVYDYGNLKNPKDELIKEITKSFQSHEINVVTSIFGGGIGMDGSSYIKIQLTMN